MRTIQKQEAAQHQKDGLQIVPRHADSPWNYAHAACGFASEMSEGQRDVIGAARLMRAPSTLAPTPFYPIRGEFAKSVAVCVWSLVTLWPWHTFWP